MTALKDCDMTFEQLPVQRLEGAEGGGSRLEVAAGGVFQRPAAWKTWVAAAG
jgi:hypothetical protein